MARKYNLPLYQDDFEGVHWLNLSDGSLSRTYGENLFDSCWLDPNELQVSDATAEAIQKHAKTQIDIVLDLRTQMLNERIKELEAALQKARPFVSYGNKYSLELGLLEAKNVSDEIDKLLGGSHAD